MTELAMMRAVVLEELGPPENLKIARVPVPEIGDQDVLIKVEAAGLIYADAEARRGTYYAKTKLPWRPGREVAGTVVKTGRQVAGFKPGQRVAAIVLAAGCQADYVVASLAPYGPANVPGADIHPLPDHVRASQALVYLINFRLAHMIFHAWAKVPRGADVLVHGAAGGMGIMVTQIAKAEGCRVLATCRTAAEAAFMTKTGVDECINVLENDYVAATHALTDGKGVPFVFNGIGGPTVDRDPLVTRPFGEIHLYGYAAGKPPLTVFDIDHTIAIKTFSADDFFPTPAFREATKAMQEWFQTRPLMEAGTILPLEGVVEAHRMLDEGRVLGKIVLTP